MTEMFMAGVFIGGMMMCFLDGFVFLEVLKLLRRKPAKPERIEQEGGE